MIGLRSTRWESWHAEPLFTRYARSICPNEHPNPFVTPARSVPLAAIFSRHTSMETARILNYFLVLARVGF